MNNQDIINQATANIATIKEALAELQSIPPALRNNGYLTTATDFNVALQGATTLNERMDTVLLYFQREEAPNDHR